MDRFIPRYDQPVSLTSLSKLDPSILSEAISTLSNSILHLVSSNEQIVAFLRPTSSSDEEGGEELDEESKREFEESVKENEKTMYASDDPERGGD